VIRSHSQVQDGAPITPTKLSSRSNDKTSRQVPTCHNHEDAAKLNGEAKKEVKKLDEETKQVISLDQTKHKTKCFEMVSGIIFHPIFVHCNNKQSHLITFPCTKLTILWEMFPKKTLNRCLAISNLLITFFGV